MLLGIIIALFGVACAIEGERRSNDDNIENTIDEINKQNKYDDDLGFNDFNK